MLKRLWGRSATYCTRSKARGRSAVLWAAGLLVAFQAAYYFPVSYLWPQMHDGEFGTKLARLRQQLAAKPKDQPCVVALGSSLTGWGFNPSALTGVKAGGPGGPVVFNFAINSGGVIVELICLRRLLDDGIRPDLLVLETHPQYFFRAYNTVPGEHYLEARRFRFEDVPVLKNYDPKWSELRHEWRGRQWVPWFYNRYNVQNYLLPDWVRRDQRNDVWKVIDRNGWEYMPGALEYIARQPPEAAVQSILHRIHNLNCSPMEERFMQAYREIIDLCGRHNVPVVMVRMPEVSYARKKYTPELRRQVDAFYAGLVRDTGIRFVDAKDWVEDRYLPDGFHLHPDGAVVFMRRLEREFLGEFFERHAGRFSARQVATAGN